MRRTCRSRCSTARKWEVATVPREVPHGSATLFKVTSPQHQAGDVVASVTGFAFSPRECRIVLTSACTSCGTALLGDFCHVCGQQRVSGRLTTREFLRDLARRVLRLDAAYARTLWRTLRSPGQLVNDYLNGKRSGILDPLQYYISAMFTQLLVSSITLIVAPLIDRTSAVSWLGGLGGVVAIKFLFVIWAGLVWRVLFRSDHRNLAEILVFTTYGSATTSLLWTALPLLDLAVPYDLARSEASVAAVTLGIEVVYM